MRPGWIVLAIIAALAPRPAAAMSADGAMITNFASLTAYWRSTGLSYGNRYQIKYNATVAALVTNPCANVAKTVTPAVQAPGGTLTYTICVVSCAVLTTSWNVVATDALPENTSYSSPSLATWCPAGAAWSSYFSFDNSAWVPGEPPDGTAPPLYLRWAIDVLAPGRSGCVTFRARVQ